MHFCSLIISAFDEVAVFITENHPEVKSVGLMGTTGTIKGGLFQKRLLESGITTLTPEQDDRKRLMSAIYSIKSHKISQVFGENNKTMVDVAENLIKRGAQGIIAGCTEIPLVLAPDDISVPLFDPLLLLAQAAVRHAQQYRSVAT